MDRRPGKQSGARSVTLVCAANCRKHRRGSEGLPCVLLSEDWMEEKVMARTPCCFSLSFSYSPQLWGRRPYPTHLLGYEPSTGCHRDTQRCCLPSTGSHTHSTAVQRRRPLEGATAKPRCIWVISWQWHPSDRKAGPLVTRGRPHPQPSASVSWACLLRLS